MSNNQGYSQTNPYAEPPKKKSHKIRNFVVFPIVGLFGLMVVVGALSSGSGSTDTPAQDAAKVAPKISATVKASEAPKPTETPKPKMTKSQEQAIGAAENYLSFKAFSRDGLIRQLSSNAGDGYSKADATFAVDHIKVNWNEQAAKAAREYLSFTHFSRRGLIEQLMSGDGFTNKQATYGVSKAGL